LDFGIDPISGILEELSHSSFVAELGAFTLWLVNAINNSHGCIISINDASQYFESFVKVTNLNGNTLAGLNKLLVEGVESLRGSLDLFLYVKDSIVYYRFQGSANLGTELRVTTRQDVSLQAGICEEPIDKGYITFD